MSMTSPCRTKNTVCVHAAGIRVSNYLTGTEIGARVCHEPQKPPIEDNS